MHEINGKRMNRYHELGQYAFGKFYRSSQDYLYGTTALNLLMFTGQRAGLWAVVPFQLIVMVGLGMCIAVH